jgi:hypothetical protein
MGKTTNLDRKTLELDDLTVTIASGQTTSGAVDLAGYVLVGIRLPSSFTGTALKISESATFGGTYQNVYLPSTSADLSLTVAQGKSIPIEVPANLLPWRFIKIISGSAEAADRTITLIVRPIQ